MLDAEQVASRHNVNINISKPANSNGLSTADAQKRVMEEGQNVLAPQKKIHPILRYLQCLCGLFNILLIVAAIFEYAVLGVEFEANKVNVGSLCFVNNIPLSFLATIVQFLKCN